MSSAGTGDTTFSPTTFALAREEVGTSLGTPLTALPSTNSTNDVAADLARQGAPHGALVVADEQLRGRGQRGRTWHSSKTGSLTFSLILRPKLTASDLLRLPLLVGLALERAVRSFVAAELRVKWPNDLLANGKKLAGVLVESQFFGQELRAVIVGIGINLDVEGAPEEISRIAVGLKEAGAAPATKERWCARILESLETELRDYEREGFAPARERLLALDALSGRSVAIGDVQGTARGIDESGALLVEDAKGRVARVCSGTVEATGTAGG